MLESRPRDAQLDGHDEWLPALESLETNLGRIHQHLAQLDRDLRQARADYRRLVDLSGNQAGDGLPPLSSLEVLTYGERRVATLAARGQSNSEVAAQLHVSVHTVKSQMASILRKLELRSRWELVHLLRQAEG